MSQAHRATSATATNAAEQADACGLHPLVLEITERQLRTLKAIYLVLGGLLAAILVAALILSDPFGPQASAGLWWLEALLAALSVLLLGVVLPLARRRLMRTERLKRADTDDLVAAGLPHGVEPRVGRQAVYLTRYTAGCVISWGLCAAVGLYGLVARMMGAGALETGLFFAAAVFAMLLLPPDRFRLRAALAEFLKP